MTPPRVRRRRWVLLGLVLAVLAGCHRQEQAPQDPPETLEQVSQKIGFGTVANLGPHRMEGSITRKVMSNEFTSDHDTQLTIVWQDWDNFETRRVVDGEVQSHVLVVDARLWVRNSKGRMERQDDPEPYRGELRLLWNFWQEGLEPFHGRVEMEPLELGILEGRPAQRYGLKLAEAPEGWRSGVTPIDLSGSVWLDQATAVRLLVEDEGSWRVGGEDGLLRRMELRLVRSAIGAPQGLMTPRQSRKARKARRAAESER